MSEIIVGIVTGIVASLIASFLFLLLMFRLRPRIAVADQIAHVVRDDGTAFYSIKLINHTKFDLMDVQMELLVLTPVKQPGGIIFKTENVVLKRSKLLRLRQFDSRDESAKYAFRLLSYDNLLALMQGNSYLHLNVFAKHSLSGFGRVFSTQYHDKRQIIEGDFEYGNSLKIVPREPPRPPLTDHGQSVVLKLE